MRQVDLCFGDAMQRIGHGPLCPKGEIKAMTPRTPAEPAMGAFQAGRVIAIAYLATYIHDACNETRS